MSAMTLPRCTEKTKAGKPCSFRASFEFAGKPVCGPHLNALCLSRKGR